MTPQTAAGNRSQRGIALLGFGNILSQGAGHYARRADTTDVWICDFDAYEEKNVTSQEITPGDVGRRKVDVGAERLKRINPRLRVHTLGERLEDVALGEFRRADVMAGGLDSRLARLRASRIAARLGVPYVDAGVRVDGLVGRVTVCDPARGTACLECAWGEAQYAGLEYLAPCLDRAAATPPTDAPAPLGAMVAACQAIESGRILSDERPESAYQVLVDLAQHKMQASRLNRSDRCRCDHRPWQIRDVSGGPSALTVKDLLELGRQDGVGAHPELRMYGKVFAAGVSCPHCGDRPDLVCLAHRMPACPRCGLAFDGNPAARATRIYDGINDRAAAGLLGRRLDDLGVRCRDVLQVRGENVAVHYEIVPATGTA